MTDAACGMDCHDPQQRSLALAAEPALGDDAVGESTAHLISTVATTVGDEDGTYAALADRAEAGGLHPIPGTLSRGPEARAQTVALLRAALADDGAQGGEAPHGGSTSLVE